MVPMGQVLKLRDFASETDERIAAAVAALISGRHLDAKDVARATGMSKAALYRKLNGSSPWKASEVTDLARHFGIRRDDLYDGLGGRVGPQPDGPLAQSVELRTFNPLAPFAENAKLGKLIPFRPRLTPHDLSIAMSS